MAPEMAAVFSSMKALSHSSTARCFPIKLVYKMDKEMSRAVVSSSREAQSQSRRPRSTGTQLASAAVFLSLLERSQSSARRYTRTQLRICIGEAAVVSSSGEARSQSRPLRSTGTQLREHRVAAGLHNAAVVVVSMSVEAPSQSSTAKCTPTKLIKAAVSLSMASMSRQS